MVDSSKKEAIGYMKTSGGSNVFTCMIYGFLLVCSKLRSFIQKLVALFREIFKK